jgi:hypothetical protein
MARCRSAGALDKPAANKVRLAAGVVTPWPFGLLKADVDIDAYRAFLRSRITVMAVSADVSKPPSASIQSAYSMRHGPTRNKCAYLCPVLTDATTPWLRFTIQVRHFNE